MIFSVPHQCIAMSDFWRKQPTVWYRRLKIGSDNLWSKKPNYVSMMKTTKLGKRKAIPLTNWTHLHLKKVLDLEQRSWAELSACVTHAACTVLQHLCKLPSAAEPGQLACTVARLSSTWNTFSSDQGLFGRSRQQNHAKTQKQITAT